MLLLEWSDFVLKIKPKLISPSESLLPLSDFDNYILYFINGSGESHKIIWVVDNSEWVIKFNIFGEHTKYWAGRWEMEFRWESNSKKIRLNREPLKVRILPSIKSYYATTM